MGGSNGKRSISSNRSDTDDRIDTMAEHQEMIETVNKHCKHKDCSYRKVLQVGCWTEYCDYIGATGHSRGCKISECDKYTTEVVIYPFDEWAKKEF